MRRMIPQKLIEWIKSLINHIIQNGNKTEIGGDLEVDGDLQVNSSILDSDGDEAIDVGTSDVSIHKNVNIGSVSEPEDLFVSGTIEGERKVPSEIIELPVSEDNYDEDVEAYVIKPTLKEGQLYSLYSSAPLTHGSHIIVYSPLFLAIPVNTDQDYIGEFNGFTDTPENRWCGFLQETFFIINAGVVIPLTLEL